MTSIEACASTPKYPLSINNASNTQLSRTNVNIDGPPIFIYDFIPYNENTVQSGHYRVSFKSGTKKLAYVNYIVKTTKFIKIPAIPVPVIPIYIYRTKNQLKMKWKNIPINRLIIGIEFFPMLFKNLLCISTWA